MPRIALFLLAATVLAADNPWTKVQDLKSGSELRIFKKGATQPLTATLDEANDERIVIVVKNEQLAIAKEDIDRIDARPVSKTKRKLVAESQVKTTDPDNTPHPNPAIPVPGTSYSSGLSMSGGSKPDFETIYRRPAAAPRQPVQ